MQRLNNKICVIPVLRGIGRAIAARFHNEGAIVIITDIDEITGAGNEGTVSWLSLRDPGDEGAR